MELSEHARQCIQVVNRVLSCNDFAQDCGNDRDLCDILSDGEVLCNLLTELSNGKISTDDATYDLHSHDLARRNLEFFLKMCREHFGMQDKDLFEPDDLLNQRNPEKVLKTVVSLSSTASVNKRISDAEIRLHSSCSMPESCTQTEYTEYKKICSHEEQALIDKLTLLLRYRHELGGVLSEWSQELIDIVFQYTEKLYTVHKDLHERLTSLDDLGYEQFCLQLHALFVDFQPRLEIYIPYFAHMPVANAKMQQEFSKNERLRQQLIRLDASFKGLGFRGLYDAPIKQPFKYVLMFKRLHIFALNLFDNLEAARSVEQTALMMESLLNKANSNKKQVEHLLGTKEVLAQVGDLPSELADPGLVGLHMADDYLKVRCCLKDRKTETQPCLCILTTKQLILALMPRRYARATFLFNAPILSSLQVKKLEKSGGVEIVLENGDKLTFEESKTKFHDLGKWVKLLDDAKAASWPQGCNTRDHNFELKTFPLDSPCSLCQQAMSGKVMQGYSCQHCSKQLHLECLKEYIEAVQNQIDRMWRAQEEDRRRLPPFQKEWKNERLLDRGAFGDVHEVLTDMGIRCAAKTVRLPVQSGSQQDKTVQEIEKLVAAEKNLCKLIHRNIVSFFWMLQQNEDLVIFMELVSGVTLKDFVKNGALDDAKIARFASQICSALNYMHSQEPPVIHRDIKGNNIMVLNEGESVKLIDFGLSMLLEATHHTAVSSFGPRGTLHFMAPELFGAESQDTIVYSRQSDIWAFGCTVYQMVSGTVPYANFMNQWAFPDFLRRNGAPELPQGRSAELKDFYACCVARDRRTRKSAADLLSHPFLTGQRITTPTGSKNQVSLFFKKLQPTKKI